jgi:15-cis-phytoene synthase
MQVVSERVHSTAADREACRAAIRTGSRTFHAASLLLPAKVRAAAIELYAFCRMADDAIDQSAAPRIALGELQRRLAAAYAGAPFDSSTDRALAQVVSQYRVPIAIPAALLEGFAWDAESRRYETLAELEAYCTRVAATVGVMMALLMGVRSPSALARAADLGVAMQLSNIARDVGEDARAGRLYLPLAWLREVGIDPERFLADPQHDKRLSQVVDRLVAAARRLYERAVPGIGELPVACRPAIHAARLMYAEIGEEVLRRAGDSVSSRAVVSRKRKLQLLVRALGAALERNSTPAAPPLAATRFLVDAVVDADRTRGVSDDAVRAAGGVDRLLNLFERLERRDRMLEAHSQ